MNKKSARDRKSVTIHVRVDGGTAKGWAAEAKRRSVNTSDFVRQAAANAMPGALPAECKAVARGGAEGLIGALDAARAATGNTLLVLVSPRQAERLLLALRMADGWRMGKGYDDGTTDRYAELW